MKAAEDEKESRNLDTRGVAQMSAAIERAEQASKMLTDSRSRFPDIEREKKALDAIVGALGVILQVLEANRDAQLAHKEMAGNV